MRHTGRIVLLVVLATAWSTGCRKEPDAKSESQPKASADASVDRAPALADTGARATGGVFNEPSASQPTTRPK